MITKETIKETSKKIVSFLRKNIVAVILTFIIFIFSYIYIAERGRRSDLEGLIKQSKDDVVRLEDQIRKSKKDFFDLQKKLSENDSIFYSIPFNNRLPVDSLLRKMSDRFDADGISFLPDNRQR